MKQKNIPIIYFHSVAPNKNVTWYKNYLTFRVSFFEELLKELCKRNYQFLFLEEYFSKTFEKEDNAKQICITFDDGYLDNYVYAYPLLKKYHAKGTIFVNPEFVQPDSIQRPTLENIWAEKYNNDKLQDLGFASWNELVCMQKSGVIDIQSHTMTHTKYISSEIIKEFHNPVSNYLYPIANAFPSRKPYYMTDSGFKNLIPFGIPFFEEKSALITKKKSVNPDFIKAVLFKLKNYDWSQYNFNEAFNIIKSIYTNFKDDHQLFISEETEEEYSARVHFELIESKLILEKRLEKPVNYCCWPHGDYNKFAKEIAHKVGYKATTYVGIGEKNDSQDFERIGITEVYNSMRMTVRKSMFNIHAFEGRFFESGIKNMRKKFRRYK